MPNKKDTGSAFEFALIDETYKILSDIINVSIILDDTYNTAYESYLLFSEMERSKYSMAAYAAIGHIIKLEPKLQYTTSKSDALQLQLMPDAAGQQGDVRDILFIRSSQGWEIGISAKNNHKAVKHSRLSATKDFGLDWVGVSCSKEYFQEIAPIFSEMQKLKEAGAYWRELPKKHETYYKPVLNAFLSEVLAINSTDDTTPSKLVQYLLGRNDFYKVIKTRKAVEVLGFNMSGTLNLGINSKPMRTVNKLKLPTEIIRFSYKPNSTDTVLLVCNEGWQISFRIHSAKSLVEPSLKFDINLVGHPESLYTHHLEY